MEFQNKPGTLVWVGNRSRPEFVDAFRFCRDHAAQLAIRRSPRELLQRPAGSVHRLIFARCDRRPIPPAIHTALTTRYRTDQWLALNSPLCDGESRTGEPWQNVRQIRFSRWSEVVPAWLLPCGYASPPKPSLGSMLVVSDRYETAEPYLDMASSIGHTILWNRHFNRSAVRNVKTVLWDDSRATPVAADQWQQRLSGTGGSSDTGGRSGTADSQRPASASASGLRHLWLVTQPQPAEIHAAIAGGITQVLTKPISLNAIFE